jgi:hypothetical protein
MCAAYCASVSDLSLEIVNGEVIIKACDLNASGVLVIPDSIEGLPVTMIDFEYAVTPGPIPGIYERGAFEDCDFLTSIVVPDSVTTINKKAFRKCDALQNIVLGRGINFIGESAFGGCVALTTITVDENNENYESIDGVLYNESRTTLIAFPGAKGGSFIVEAPVKSIASEAFYGCNSLMSLLLPNTIVDIGNYAFKDCWSLTSILLPEGVLALGNQTFQDCISLQSVNIPQSLTSLPIGCFWGCTSLEALMVPDNIQAMGYSVFKNCSNLTSVTLPPQMTLIPESAFENCDSLKEVAIHSGIVKIDVLAFYDCDALLEIIIPKGVVEIGYAAFDRCDALQKIEVEIGNPGYSSMNGVFYNADVTELINFPGGRGGIFRVPDGVTTIDISAFAECKQLKQLLLPTTLTLIEEFAFNECESLNQVVFLGDLPDIRTHTRWWEDPVVIVGAFEGANLELEFYLYEDANGTHRSMIETYPVRLLSLDEDHDHDGLSNKIERVLGTNPASGSSRLLAWLEGDRLRFTEIRETVPIVLLWSHNLSEWHELDIEPSGRPYDAGFNLPSLDGAPFNFPSEKALFFKVAATTED